MTPAITAVAPATGPTSGGMLVRLEGTDFVPRIAVWFGDALGEVVEVFADPSTSLAYVQAPAHEQGVVDVAIENLDVDGNPTGERFLLAAGFRFERTDLGEEGDLTRLVRALLRVIKRDLLENTTLRVSLDYTREGEPRPAPASLPALVVVGPRLVRNAVYATNEPRAQIVMTSTGPELVRSEAPLTIDLAFTLKGSSNRIPELLNLIGAVEGFFARTKWIEMQRDERDLTSERVRWELDQAGDVENRIEGPDDLGEFTVDFVVRGFDIESGIAMARIREAEDIRTESNASK